jgi:hypothetical protein
MDLKKNTIDAPSAVRPQVNKVAKSAKRTGLYWKKKLRFIV